MKNGTVILNRGSGWLCGQQEDMAEVVREISSHNFIPF